MLNIVIHIEVNTSNIPLSSVSKLFNKRVIFQWGICHLDDCQSHRNKESIIFMFFFKIQNESIKLFVQKIIDHSPKYYSV